MTESELATEHAYRVAERLGILCGADKPTPEQLALATAEADDTIMELRWQALEDPSPSAR